MSNQRITDRDKRALTVIHHHAYGCNRTLLSVPLRKMKRPGAVTPPFGIGLRNAPTIGDTSSAITWAVLTITAVITLSACPAMVIPCGFDQYARPIGLQLVGRPRREAALLQAAPSSSRRWALTGCFRSTPSQAR